MPVPDSGIPREIVEAAREQIESNRAPSAAGNRVWVLSGGIGRCAACDRVLRSRKRAKKKGERRYLYYYYRCSGYDAHGYKGCSNSRFASAAKLERQVWEVLRESCSILNNSAPISIGP
ncbi:MAG TPA: recombinase zinc beta ribbon domain-containing protein [Rubrobacteraceae bacterium]|nr:recombinase zinc beta ribbon domain-containing protein [Rubrobacteraceae bacterium]